MVTCFLCKHDTFSSVKILYNHFKEVHGLYKQHAMYICCEGQCSRMFDDKYTFGRHVATHHPDSLCTNSILPKPMTVTVGDHAEAYNSCTCANGSESGDTTLTQEKPVTRKMLKDIAAKCLAECKSGTSTLAQTKLAAKCSSDVVNFIVSDVEADVESLSQMCTSPEQQTAVSNLLYKLDSYRRPFEGLESEHSFRAYLESSGYYVSPSVYVIGSRTNSSLQTDTGFVKSGMTECTGQYISVAKMILALNANTDLLTQILMMNNKSDNDGKLNSFFDGSYWKRHALYGEQTLVIRLYGDDFEPCNPLGARKTLYKIGAIYYQFEGLPAVLQSKTENIFLALCYHSDDVKTFGWKAVLHPLISELKTLESEGLTLFTKNGSVSVKVVISCVTGDNLFLNGVLGFVESFSARFPCRHCLLPKTKFASTFAEDQLLIRTVTRYDADAEKHEVQLSGIKLASPLNELEYFHAAENFVQDIMHDILEGVCQYDMILIVRHLSLLPDMSLSRVNGLIEHFSYGRHDMSNRPVKLTECTLRGDMLPMTASQTWCFTRVLSLAVGSLVPEDNSVWSLYLHLREILDILFAPSVDVGELRLLAVLIAEYLEMRMSLFPEHKLKNKHHHMVHYPRLIGEVGPLHRFWCMRFESKHLRSKRLMHMSCNFKNVPYTIASRHQYDVAHRMLAGSDSCPAIKLGSGTVTVLSDLTCSEAISACMNDIGLNFELYSCRSAEVYGISYSCGCYLLFDIVDDLPQFARLTYIFSRDQGQHVWFVCARMDTEYFSHHLHAWKVNTPVSVNFISLDPRFLMNVLPLSVHCLSSGSYIHGIRHRV